MSGILTAKELGTEFTMSCHYKPRSGPICVAASSLRCLCDTCYTWPEPDKQNPEPRSGPICVAALGLPCGCDTCHAARSKPDTVRVHINEIFDSSSSPDDSFDSSGFSDDSEDGSTMNGISCCGAAARLSAQHYRDALLHQTEKCDQLSGELQASHQRTRRVLQYRDAKNKLLKLRLRALLKCVDEFEEICTRQDQIIVMQQNKQKRYLLILGFVFVVFVVVWRLVFHYSHECAMQNARWQGWTPCKNKFWCSKPENDENPFSECTVRVWAPLFHYIYLCMHPERLFEASAGW